MISHISLACLLPYVGMSIAVLAMLLSNNVLLQRVVLVIATGLAAFYGKVGLGVIALAAIFLLAMWMKQTKASTVFHKILFFLLAALMTLLCTHQLPGFHNCLVIEGAQVSADGIPFNMYFNFDKVLSALFLICAIGQEKTAGKPWMTSRMLLIFAFCMGTLMSLVFFLKYLHWDPKLPSILGLWAVNNLIMVCFAEEVFFRGFLQRTLWHYFENRWIPILIASVLFGLVHYTGGWYYVLACTVAGIFFGHAYAVTGRLLSVMLFHFALNLMHILLFTYPALKV